MKLPTGPMQISLEPCFLLLGPNKYNLQPAMALKSVKNIDKMR
jgi:hypothetical protein